jgi:hypothetical protein
MRRRKLLSALAGLAVVVVAGTLALGPILSKGGKEGDVEVLIENCTDRERSLAALAASSDEDWLKIALKAEALLGQPFAVCFESGNDANVFADRIRCLGFECRVWEGPSPSQRVKANG